MTLPYQSHSKTSQDAAIKNEKSELSNRNKIMKALRECAYHGATGKEISGYLGLDTGRVSARLTNLHDDGEAVKSDIIRDGGYVWFAPEYCDNDTGKKRDRVKLVMEKCAELERIYKDPFTAFLMKQIKDVLTDTKDKAII